MNLLTKEIALCDETEEKNQPFSGFDLDPVDFQLWDRIKIS